MKCVTIPLLTVCLATAAAGCGSSNSTSPTPSNLVVFTVTLLPSNETPPITNAENSARGTAVVTVHKDTNVIDMNVSVTGFPAGSVLNNAHIHGPNAPAGVPAGVFVPSGIAAANFPALVNGAATFTASPSDAGADKVAQILANPSQFYFNVHTVANGGGVIRGQLQ
jgi:hypothetical protein